MTAGSQGPGATFTEQSFDASERPAHLQPLASTKPCKCGYLDDASRACSRAPKCAEEYQSKISGPLFDRIDLHVEAPAVNPADLSLPPAAEGSKQVAERVAAARARQTARYADKGIRANAEADGGAKLDRLPPSAVSQLRTPVAHPLKARHLARFAANLR